MGGLDIFDQIKRRLRGQEEKYYTPSPITTPSVSPDFARFSDLLPYLAWMKDEELFVLEGDEGGSVEAIGFALEMIPQTGAPLEMAELLTSVFLGVPPGTSFQFQLFASPDISPFLQAYKAVRVPPEDGEKGSAFRLYAELCDKRIAHFQKGSTRGLIPNTPYLFRNFRVVFSVTVPTRYPNDPDLLKQIRTMRDTYITTLQTYYQFSHAWSPSDLINWCAMLLNPHTAMRGPARNINYDDGRKIANQIVSPDTVIRVAPDGLRFGLPQNGDEIVAHTMSVISYPKQFTLHMMGELIGDWSQNALGYPCPFVISLNAVALDHEDSRNKTQMKQARATQNAESQMAKFLPDLAEKKEDWDIAQFAFDDGRGLVWMAHELTLFSPPADLSRAIQSAVAVWRAKQFELASNTYMQLQSMLSSLPMTMSASLKKDVEAAHRWTTKTTFNAVNMAPLIGEWVGVGRPVLPLWGRRGQAMGIDLFANDAGNFNACVVGAPGSGKSVLLNDLALSYLSIGGRCWIIDVGRSYEKLCHTVGGQFIEFTHEANICLNPFPLITDFEEDIQMLVPLFEQMISPSQRLSDYERSQLQIHIRSLWYEKGPAMTVGDVAQSLINNCEKGGPNPLAHDEGFTERVRAMSADERDKICDPAIRRLGVQLFSYTEDGSYGKYFSGEPNMKFDSPFIVLELDELESKPDLQAVVMYLLLYKIDQEMYLSHKSGVVQEKLVIIDEAWSLLRGGNNGAFIEKGYRRARKHQGSFITGTQSVADYSMSPAAEAAINNSDWMFFLRQKPESIEAIQRSGRLVLDEAMKRQMLSLNTRQGVYSEVLVHCGQKGYGIARMFMDPFSLLLSSSKAADFAAVKQYRMKGMSVPDAINAVLADRNLQ